jgi:hypothetical protein
LALGHAELRAESHSEVQAWSEKTSADSFNLDYALVPESFSDFADLGATELQRRGVHKSEYRSGTLREKLFPSGVLISVHAFRPRSPPNRSRRDGAPTAADLGRPGRRDGRAERAAIGGLHPSARAGPALRLTIAAIAAD